jgi:N-methylhydantoinase B
VFRPEGIVTARGMERLRFSPWGVSGGSAAATGSVVLNPGTAAERPLAKIDVLSLEPGDVLSVRTPGGGGHGDRFQRPAARVLDDVVAGLISREHAREAYGVVLRGDRVDEEATASLRQSGSGPAAAAPFDFGPARCEHERRWPAALQDAFIELLMSLPAPYRVYVRRKLYARVDALAAQRPVTADDLHDLWHNLRGSIGLA